LAHCPKTAEGLPESGTLLCDTRPVEIVANIAELVSDAAEQAADDEAIQDAARSVTWSRLDEETHAVASGLASMGLVAGARVVLALGNRIEFVTSYLGVLRAGLVAVPANPASVAGEFVRMVADSGARCCMCDRTSLQAVRAALQDLDDLRVAAPPDESTRMVAPQVVIVAGSALPTETTYEDLIARDSRPVSPPVDPQNLAVLLYTSGTSGRPRAAMLTHLSLLTNIEQAAAVEPPPITSEDVVLGVVPLFHVYGLNAVLGQVLRQRARLVLVERFDPAGTLAVIEQQRVTNLPVAPPVFAAWQHYGDLRERLRSVRIVLSGSAPLGVDAIKRFSDQSGLPVHQGYGLTEASPAVTSTLGSANVKPGSVGSALPGVELRVVDDRGHEVSGDDSGEICVRGGNVFVGYWPNREGGPDEDGWFATGDVGYLDDEGDLFLVDRKRELVIVSGFNVYPTEVEDVIVELTDVFEAAVIGAPDDESGEAVVAYVVPQDGVTLSPKQLAAMVDAHCAHRLARFKRPREIHVVEELPHSVTGKVAKGRLRSVQRRRAMGLM
jgi:long-chain acyl-CoA synthetase